MSSSWVLRGIRRCPGHSSVHVRVCVRWGGGGRCVCLQPCSPRQFSSSLVLSLLVILLVCLSLSEHPSSITFWLSGSPRSPWPPICHVYFFPLSLPSLSLSLPRASPPTPLSPPSISSLPSGPLFLFLSVSSLSSALITLLHLSSPPPSPFSVFLPTLPPSPPCILSWFSCLSLSFSSSITHNLSGLLFVAVCKGWQCPWWVVDHTHQRLESNQTVTELH